MRAGCLAVALLLAGPVRAGAEWHIKPFVGLTFGGGTTFPDVEEAVGKPNGVFGATVVLLTNTNLEDDTVDVIFEQAVQVALGSRTATALPITPGWHLEETL